MSAMWASSKFAGNRRRGQKRHLVTVETAGPLVPDGQGGYTPNWLALDPPQMWASIEGPPGEDEAVAGNVERARVSHTVEMDYHPDVTLQSRIVLEDGRILSVRGLVNVEERSIELVLSCEEII